MILDKTMLDSLSLEAASTPRRRRNLNFHPFDASACNRLLNAMEPDSYIQPHSHLDTEKDETIILLRGKLGVLFFSEEGDIVMKTVLDPASALYGVDVSHGTIHTLVCLESGTVFFEAKAGPYVPLSDAERVAWAPKEGEPAVAAYLQSLKELF